MMTKMMTKMIMPSIVERLQIVFEINGGVPFNVSDWERLSIFNKELIVSRLYFLSDRTHISFRS